MKAAEQTEATSSAEKLTVSETDEPQAASSPLDEESSPMEKTESAPSIVEQPPSDNDETDSVASYHSAMCLSTVASDCSAAELSDTDSSESVQVSDGEDDKQRELDRIDGEQITSR